MQQFETLLQRDFVLARGQRQRVGIVIEQRIATHRRIHLVEVHPLGVLTQAERRLVRDEMHFVPAPGEVQPELGRHGTGAAVGRVTGDPDSHPLVSSHAAMMAAASSSGGRVASRVSTSPRT